ncbi:hypothetical protein AVEN_153980-1 [Araneus ventricosus]|uniref:Uncharacterized protein n=1 Tax=Araneus ventricosus TaxID=182803 RepID=A0A4Y2IUG9_ARAVE|nr:hypothetical protein AVEN_153980-1 [Araneus ventricosus]
MYIRSLIVACIECSLEPGHKRQPGIKNQDISGINTLKTSDLGMYAILQTPRPPAARPLPDLETLLNLKLEEKFEWRNPVNYRLGPVRCKTYCRFMKSQLTSKQQVELFLGCSSEMLEKSVSMLK